MLTENQIQMLASDISANDIVNYVTNHKKEYEMFLEKEKNKNKIEDDPYTEIINKAISTGKLEVPILK